MRTAEMAKLVPQVMRELHDNGLPWIYKAELAKKVIPYDKEYRKKRAWLRKQLAHIGIYIAEHPSVLSANGWVDLSYALRLLEKWHVIESEIFYRQIPGRKQQLKLRGYRLVPPLEG